MKLINKIKLLVIFALTLIASLCFVACDSNGGGDAADVTVPDFNATVPVDNYNTYTDTHDNTVVTLDGTITDAEWASQNKWDTHVTIGGYDHHVEVWSRFAAEGVVMAYRVTGAPAFYVAGRGDYANSGIEIYVANGNATTPNGNQWEMEFFANGAYHTSRWLDTTHPLKNYTQNNYTGTNTYIDLAGRWLDKDGNTTYINNYENNGYEDEVMIPWYVFGGEKCDSIVFNAAIQFMTDDYSAKRSGYVNLLDALEGDSYWSACQKWCRFDADGYYDKTKTAWSVTPYDLGVEIDDEQDGMNLTGLGWNASPNRVLNNTNINSDKFFVTTKLYAPHLAHEENSAMWNELLENENDTRTQAQGGTETAYNGIRLNNGSTSVEIAFRKDWGTQFHLRWNANAWGWTTYVVPTALAEKYKTDGLNLGILVEGKTVKVLLENADGMMEVIPSMTKTVSALDSSLGYKAGIYYQCDTKFDNFKIYYGDTMNQSVQIVNETAADAKGTVTAQGAVGGNLVVNVAPDEGYELATLTINGIDYASYANNNQVVVSNYAYGTAKIAATFREEISQSISLNVTHKFAYESEAYACNGLSVILKDTEGNAYGGMVVNGVATIKVPDGTYTITCANHVNASTIEIVNGETETTAVVLVRKIFDEVDDTVTAVMTGDGESTTGATLQTTVKANVNEMLDDKQWKISSVDFSGKVILVYTLNMGPERECYATIETNRHINTMNQGHWDDTTGYYDAPNNEWTVGKKHSESTTFALIYEGESQITFAEKVDGNFQIVTTFDDTEGELTYICFTQGQHSAIITWSDIKVYDGERADAMLANTVTVSEESSDKINLTVDKAKAQNGEIVTINASVKEGNDEYHLAGVSVNGEVLEAVDGVYSFVAEGYGNSYVVKATAEKETYALTFNTTWKFAYETGDAYAVADGTELKFGNAEVSKIAIVENGKVTVRLSNGTYTCGNTTIVVENGTTATTAIEAIRNVVKSYDATKTTVTESANGAHIVTKLEDSIAFADLDMSNALVVLTVAKDAAQGPWTDLLISPYGWDTQNTNGAAAVNQKTNGKAGGYRFDFRKVQDGIQLQLGGNALGDHTTRDNGQTSTLVIRTTADGLTSKAELYVKHYDDQYTLVGYLTHAVTSLSEIYFELKTNAANMVYDVQVYDGASATAYFDAMELYEQDTPAAMTIDGVKISTSSKFVQFEDGAIITNAAFKPDINFSASAAIVAMTYNVQLLDDKFTGTCDGDGAWIITKNTSGIEFIHQDVNKIGYRFRAGNWSRYYFTDAQMTAIRSEGGVAMGAYLANGGNIMLKNGDGVWYNAKHLDPFDAAEITGMSIRTAMKLTDIHFYTQETWDAYMASLGGDVNVENGKATVQVNPIGSTVVTVVPDEGYVLDTLKVEGTDVTLQVVNNVYTITNGNENGKFAIDVDVSFKLKPAAKWSVKLNAKTNTAYNIGAAYVGSATLTGANGEYTATVAEGVLNFGEVIEGTYTLIIANYANQVIVVEEEMNEDVNLFYVTEGATTAEIVGNDVVYTFTDTEGWKKIILPANTTAVTFKVAIKNYTVPDTLDTCGLHVNSDKTGTANEIENQAEIWLHKGLFRPRLCWRTQAYFTAYQTAKLTGDGLTMKVAIENGALKLFVEEEDGTLALILKNDNCEATVLTNIQERNITGGVEISELIATTANANGAIILNKVENAAITATKAAIAKGEESVITVTPTDNYVVSAVTVNGKLATMVSGENGAIKVTLKGSDAMLYNVNAVVTAAAGTEQTYTVDHKYAYEAAAYAIADNTVISFVGKTATYLGVVNAGKVTVTAPEGEYTVRLNGHKDQTVTVGDRANIEAGAITLVRTLINYDYTVCELDVSETETGAKVSNTKNQLTNPPITAIQVGDDITGKTVYTMTVKYPQAKWGSCPRLWFFDGANTYTKVEGTNIVNIVLAEKIYFKPSNEESLIIENTTEVNIVVVVEDDTVKVYVKAATADTYTFVTSDDDSTEYTLKLASNITKFTVGATDGSMTWDMEAIKAYDGVRADAALVALGLANAEAAE